MAVRLEFARYDNVERKINVTSDPITRNGAAVNVFPVQVTVADFEHRFSELKTAMDPEQSKPSTHPTAGEDAELARSSRVDNPSYRLACADEDFIVREELRAVRLQLEWLKADLVLQEQRIESTVVVFGEIGRAHV